MPPQARTALQCCHCGTFNRTFKCTAHAIAVPLQAKLQTLEKVNDVPAATGQDGSAVLSLWNMRAFKRIANLPAMAPATALAYSPDGSSLAALCADGSAQLLDPYSRAPVASWQVRWLDCAA